MSAFAAGLGIGFFGCAPVLHRYGGRGALAYVLVCAGVFTLAYRVLARRAPWAKAAALGLLLASTVAFAILYPIANDGSFGGGSDRDEALTLATQRLLTGHFPYAEPTYLGNPITPLPGALIIASPLVAALGDSAPLSLLALVASVLFAARAVNFRAAALVAFANGALSLEAVRDLVTGGDLLANTLCVCVASLYALQAQGHRKTIAFALLGLTLAWRVNFLLGLPLLAMHTWRSEGAKRAIGLAATALATAGLPTVLIYAWDPAHFSPFHTFGELGLIDAAWPRSSVVLGLASAGAALLLAARGSVSTAARDLGLVQAIWLLGAVAFAKLSGQHTASLLSFGVVCAPWFAFHQALKMRTPLDDADCPEGQPSSH